jgi:hypothetical protein
MKNNEKLLELIQKLVGEPISVDCYRFNELRFFDNGNVLGYSQFNEILLLLGFDRITQSFFQFLVDQEIVYDRGSAIRSLTQLEKGVTAFRKMAILIYANVKFGFKELARDANELRYQLLTLAPYPEEDFAYRHLPILTIEPIKPEETYLLGYKIKDKLIEDIKNNPQDLDLQALNIRRVEIIEVGKRNQISYLTSDHLDVYVATSMRLRHEFISVSRTVQQLEGQKILRDLSLRFFDPTQAYCENRIDKGLSEGLMLKRAKCTVYLVQESDTLGKDSELASTLAQGKPVVAIVPNGNVEFVNNQIALFKESYRASSDKTIILELLKIYDPSIAWSSSDEGKTIREYINDQDGISDDQVLKILYAKAKKHYDDRFKTLFEIHPLGIQVDLETGVATGVLVVRDIESCAKLIRSHVLRLVEYDIHDNIENGTNYTYLREKISGCVYRVITGDPVLTNAFWNFYLNEPHELPQSNEHVGLNKYNEPNE